MQVMQRDLRSGEPDVCLLEEPDPRRFLELTRTKDGAYVTVNSNSKTDSEVRAFYAIGARSGLPSTLSSCVMPSFSRTFDWTLIEPDTSAC